jgi:hypothetical protein
MTAAGGTETVPAPNGQVPASARNNVDLPEPEVEPYVDGWAALTSRAPMVSSHQVPQ